MATTQRLRDLEERLSGLDSNRLAGLQQVYFVIGSGLVLAALLVSVAVDVLRGDAAGATRVGCLILLLTWVIARGHKLRSKPRPLYRVLLAAGLAVVTYEAFTGANAGFSFLWFYVFPIPSYFLLGRREARLWIVFVVLILAGLLFGVDSLLFPGGHPGLMALLSLGLLGLLTHGLDAARESLEEELLETNQGLQQARADVDELQGLVPLCVRCQNPRNDAAYRRQVTSYLSRTPNSELATARCPTSAEGRLDDSGSTALDRAVFRLQDLWAGSQGARLSRRRRFYFALGLLTVLPFLGYLATEDFLSGRWIDAGITFILVLILGFAIFALRRSRYDRWIYQTGLAAILLTLGYDLYAGSFDGFAALWFYAFPVLALLVYGTVGILWTLPAFLLCGFFLLSPVGHSYPIEFTWRFFATFLLTSVMAFWMERLRQRAQSDLESERQAVHETLRQRQALHALLPVCPDCGDDKEDPEFRRRIEDSISGPSSARFQHGLCSVCAEKGSDA